MGRKPNPLILEYFERGQKLEDASNRYQHTCKACGEKFPKGRIDSLMGHLTNKCPAIRLRDKQHASRHLQDLRVASGADIPVRTGSAALVDRRRAGASTQRRGGGGGAATEHGWTPLRTLAEVSRVVDLSERHTPTPQDPTGMADELDEDAMAQDRNEVAPIGSPLCDYWPTRVSKDMDASATLAPTQVDTPSMGSDLIVGDLPGISLPASSMDMGRAAELLPMAALAANNLASQASSKPGAPARSDLDGLSHSGLSDKVFASRGPEPRDALTWPVDPLLLGGASGHIAGPDMTGPYTSSPSYPIAIDMQLSPRTFASFNVSTSSPRQKSRSRFSPNRRKEVQMVRKIGACIRCRMLKKPCSNELPCATCRNVESARLWTQPCIRTRIADELKLYSAGLYGVLAARRVGQLKTGTPFHQYSGQIKATHDRESGIFAVLDALEGDTQQVLILDPDRDNVTGKIEKYTRKMIATFVEQEPSKYVQPIFQSILQLSDANKDPLLQRVLELWSVNRVFVDLGRKWVMFRESGLDDLDDRSVAIEHETDEPSYEVLCLQLRAAAEGHAAQLSKALLNELERRLLQRTHSGWFETYLATIGLLNCIERSSWLFRTWNYEKYQREWPLDQKPLDFYHQSERFADMLHMLLKIRGLPPKAPGSSLNGGIMPTADMTLQEHSKSISIPSKVLEERQDATFDPDDFRSLELKLCAKLMLAS